MKKINKIKFIVAIILCILIVVTYFFFNMKYLSRFIDADTWAYSINVEVGVFRHLFSPHHLFYDFSGHVFYRATQDIGNLGVDAFINLRIKNLIIASIFAGLIFLFLFRLSGKFVLSLLITGFIVFSKGFVSYAHTNDTPLIHSGLCIIMFFILYYYRSVKKKKLFVIFLALFHSFLIFFHQTDLIFYPVVIFYIFANKNELNVRKKIYLASVYSIILAVVVSGMYLYIGTFIVGTKFNIGQKSHYLSSKGADFFQWITYYAHWGHWGKGHEGSTLYKIFYGLSNSFSQGETQINLSSHIIDFKNFFSMNYYSTNLIFTLLGASLISYCVLFKKLYKKYGPIIGALLIWLIVYLCFFSWWEPEYYEFWLITSATFFIILFFVLDFIIDNLRKLFLIKILSNTIIYTLIIGIFIITFGSTYYNVIYKRSIKQNYGWLSHVRERVLKYKDYKMYKNN